MRRWVLGLIFLVVVAVAVGCERPTLTAEMTDDGPAVPVTRESAISFIQKSVAAGQGASSGLVSWQVTQEEVTSFIALGADLAELLQMQNRLGNLTPAERARLDEILTRLEIDESQISTVLAQLEAQQEAAGLGGLPIPDLALRLLLREPQIYFRANGQIIARGYGEIRGRSQPIRLVFAPRASAGELELTFVEGMVGPIAVPDELINAVGSGVARAILAGNAYAEITELRVEEGVLTFGGQRK